MSAVLSHAQRDGQVAFERNKGQRTVGAGVGAIVGGVGAFVGDGVGSGVGDGVGSVVGDKVGAPVGACERSITISSIMASMREAQ